MGCCKSLLFIITFVLLCSGIFGHRFQRHLNAVSPTPAIENVELNNFNNRDYELASDGSIGVPDENNVNNVKLIGRGEIELELLHGELEFQVCTEGCMEKQVSVCFDGEKYNGRAQGKCSKSDQCEFRAGVKEVYDENRMWVMIETHFVIFNDKTCPSSQMHFPSAEFFEMNFDSCKPVKRDGNVVKLYVTNATESCPLYVLGAKKWFPPTPPPPMAAPELSTEKPTSSKPPPSSSTADSSNTLWIVIGVVSGILGIALLIGLGCLIYHCCIKKKSTDVAAAIADGKKNPISTETKTITEVQAPTVKQETAQEKAVEEEKKNGVQEKVTTTKEETEEPKLKNEAPKRKSKKQIKKGGKEKKKTAPPKANRTKPTQEETPRNATEPTFEDTTAQSMVSQKPTAPTLRVLDKIIVPERPYATSNRSYSKSRKTDSLSGNHDLHTESKYEVKKQPPHTRAHHQNRVRRSMGKKEKLVEYNQKSIMDKM